MNTVTAWLFSFIVTFFPVDAKRWVPASRETPDDAKARYESIVADAASVLYDPANPPFFKGDHAREKTAAVFFAVMKTESGFRKDVDYNLVMDDGEEVENDVGSGDGGDSWCLMQLDIGKHGHTQAWNATRGRFKYPSDRKTDTIVPGFSGAELVEDRKKCFLTAYRYMKVSFEACSQLPIEDGLAMYASGKCDGGHKASEIRMRIAMNWLKKNKPTFNDREAMTILFPPPAAPAPLADPITASINLAPRLVVQ